MSLSVLVGKLGPLAFVEQYYQKLPFSCAATAGDLCALGSWTALQEIIERSNADATDTDVMVVRQSARYEGPDPADVAAARALFDEGYTLLVRHAEQSHDGLAKLTAKFRKEVAGSVNIHMYFTPGGQHGFGWHYDAEEVFIVQTQGRKEYSLRKNTVNPWPTEETLPRDMAYQREVMPLVKCELSAGDFLYIPSGYWHKAEAQEDAFSLAIGVMPTTGVDFFDHLRQRVLDSMLWRQRFPTLGTASPLTADEQRAQYREIVRQLGEDFTRMLTDDRVLEKFMAERR